MHLLSIILLFPILGSARLPVSERPEPAVVYVSPAGNPNAGGTRSDPLGSLQSAIDRVSPSGGTVRLLGGVYREAAVVPPGISPEVLVIEAANGERVVFDGSKEIPEESGADHSGLVVYSAANVVNLWDKNGKYRYLKQLDEAGVRAIPGSFSNLPDNKLLVHRAPGAEPGGLRANLGTQGIEVQRDATTIRGIEFENFLGTKTSAGVVIGDAKNVEITECRIRNSVRGVLVGPKARKVRIANCEIRDVATGIHFSGVGLVAEDNLIFCASGEFAIREEADFDELNGIRFYHPAEEGTVRRCVTAGFWAGLYQKTTPGRSGPKPFICEGNIFLDGIRTGTASQAGNRYMGNVSTGGNTVRERLESLGAFVEQNFFFTFLGSRSAEDSRGNILGGNPFVDLSGGLLSLQPDSDLPPPAASAVAVWAGKSIGPMPESILRQAAIQETETPQFASVPVCASSRAGAVVTASFTTPVNGVLKYRVIGEPGWLELRGVSVSKARPMEGSEGEDGLKADSALSTNSLVFALLDGTIEPDREYEFRIEADGGLISETMRFATRGGPKTLEVEAKPGGNTLQSALNQALPGDTVRIGEGVHTGSAVLVHGGTPQAPLTIQGAGQQTTILDGGRRHSVMLDLRGAANVVIKDLQVRLFESAGIAAEKSPGLIVEGCRFLNKEISSTGYTKGTGVLLKRSPGSSVSRCVFTRLLYGVQAIDSPGLVLTHNTAFKNLYSAAMLKNSARNSRVLYNSFTFTGNISFYLIEDDPGALQTLACNFNNYGTVIRTITETVRRAYTEAGAELPEEIEEAFQLPDRYGALSGSKRIIDFKPDSTAGGDSKRMRFFTMNAWQKFSGKDTHSVFADPQYVDPLNGDFRLMLGSPNAMGQSDVAGAFDELVTP